MEVFLEASNNADIMQESASRTYNPFLQFISGTIVFLQNNWHCLLNLIKASVYMDPKSISNYRVKFWLDGNFGYF